MSGRFWQRHPVRRTLKTTHVRAIECVVAQKIIADGNHAIAIAEAHQNALMPRGCLGKLPIHIRTTCVAQENGVGKLAARNNGRGLGRTFLTSLRVPESIRVGSERLTILAATLLLAACATPTVTRSCLTQQQYEQFKASEPTKVHDKLTGDADKDTRPLAGSALELRSWGHAMLDTLKICSEAP